VTPSGVRQTWWRDALGLAALAALVRAGYVLAIVKRYGSQPYSDADFLHRLARSLAAGTGFCLNGYRIFNQSVGYPAFLAPFYRAFGPDVLVALGLNVLLGALSVALVYVLTRRLLTGQAGEPVVAGLPVRGIALGAAGLAVVYPDSLLYTAIVASENLLIPLMLAMLLAVLWRTRRDVMAGTVAGVLVAAAASTKAQAVVGCVLVPLVWLLDGQRAGRRVVAAAVAGAACLAPWALINYRDSGHFVPLAAVGGEVLLDGTNPLARGFPTGVLTLGPESEPVTDPVVRDRLKMKRAIGYIRQRPAWFLWLEAHKILFSFSPVRDYMFEDNGVQRLFTPLLGRAVPTLFNLLLMIGTAVGCWTLRRQHVPLVIAASLLLGMFSTQWIFFAFPRYRFPFYLCLLPYVAVGCHTIAQAYLRRRRGYELAPSSLSTAAVPDPRP
jgi:hypothetical protein